MAGRPRKHPKGPFRNRIKEIREQLGISQPAAARRCGMAYQTYNKIENGHTRLNIVHMQQLANGLGCAPTELLPGEMTLDQQSKLLLSAFGELSTDDRQRLLDSALAWLQRVRPAAA